MLKVHSFAFNPFQENTFILANEDNECFIVDPGCYDASEQKQLVNFIQSNGLKPKRIIQTHNHLDHIFGICHVQRTFGIEMTCHEQDLPTLDMAEASAKAYGFGAIEVPDHPTTFIAHNEIISLGKSELEVRFAPGHCQGHVIFVNHQDQYVIAGDCLFNGSIGRTDLPGGNHETLLTSIKEQLYSLPDNFTVYCGHGPSTTIGNEKKSNPFVRG